MMGGDHGWAIVLVKKTPFSPQEKDVIRKYFQDHDTTLLFPTAKFEERKGGQVSYFDYYALLFMENQENSFISAYPYDISVITDDNPFFYKYYKFTPFILFHTELAHHTGTIIFLTQ